MATKLDLKKELKQFYSSSPQQVSIVDVPRLNFLMIDGKGDPNSAPEYQQAIDALYGVSFTLKFMIKNSPTGTDYVVMPLEGLWWQEGGNAFSINDKDNWLWTAMIMQPQFVTAELAKQATEEVEKKKKLPALGQMRFDSLHEGLAVQIMHIGPYSDEAASVAKLHGFMRNNGYEFAGKHHEIYLSDPRRTKPQRLRTIIRQPVRPVAF